MNHGYFQRQLPTALADLADLAMDLRWNNCPAARHLWKRFDPEMWAHTENPLLVLQSAHQHRIDAAAEDEVLLAALEEWKTEVKEYYSTQPEFSFLDPERKLKCVAYFSMEFGLSESLPIYSGGLGMLAGDHLKTASDLGVPLVGIGLLYQQGYFRQEIGMDGQQRESYPFNDPGSLPVRAVADKDGHWMRVRLPLPGRTLFLRVWEARVGRVRLFLLDSNDAMNTPWDRGITAQLYDARRDRRLPQEIVLGVGGWNLIERLGLDIDVCHLNEGHAAFAVLARAASFAKQADLPVPVAFTATRAGNVFTTHTPVEAAFDCFDPNMIAHYAQPFIDEAGFPLEELLRLGRRNKEDQSEPFNMAWLAMRGCGHVNAVSRLHGEVSRGLFSALFPRWPQREVPVQSITNGVHVPTWSSHNAAIIWGDEDGGHLWLDGLKDVSNRVRNLPDDQLWAFRTAQRRELLTYVEANYCHTPDVRSEATGAGPSLFDPNVLTIGFARRFATYKRANLMLSDTERLARLMLDKNRPVQLLVAGKAHPNDDFGKSIVQQLTQFIRRPEFLGRAIFLEDYDMILGQHLVAGVDVWLNTPLRPNEACGTSGMKVLANGGLNASILDGWWDEAFAIEAGATPPGWIVGSRDSGSPENLSARDASSLFDVLEHQIIPEFYDREPDGVPHRWISRVKSSMASLTPKFSATRMLHEYIEQAYLPAASGYAKRSAHNASLAKEIRSWTNQLRAQWYHIRFGQLRFSEEAGSTNASVECWLGNIPIDAVRVQLYCDAREHRPVSIVDLQQIRELPGSVNGFLYCGVLPAEHRPCEYALRIVPYHPDAIIPIENQCIQWND